MLHLMVPMLQNLLLSGKSRCEFHLYCACVLRCRLKLEGMQQFLFLRLLMQLQAWLTLAVMLDDSRASNDLLAP